MWIRSQDRDCLINVNDVCFYKLTYKERKTYQFRCYGFGDDYYILGNYSSKEKAMKVLDMIQDFEIRHQANLLLAIYSEANDNAEENMVFQMPQDSEVEV